MTSDGVYVFYHPEEYAKVGKAKDHDKRFQQIQRGSPYELEYWRQVSTLYSGSSVETAIHKRLFNNHVRGEWFSVSKSRLSEVLETVAGENKNVLSVREPYHEPETVVPNSVKPEGYKYQMEGGKHE